MLKVLGINRDVFKKQNNLQYNFIFKYIVCHAKISSLRRPWSIAPRYYTGDRLKGDERILGDSEFVQSILSQANDHFERYYELQRL